MYYNTKRWKEGTKAASLILTTLSEDDHTIQRAIKKIQRP